MSWQKDNEQTGRLATMRRLLSDALPFIEGQRDGSEWDEAAIDLADDIRSVLSDYEAAERRPE